MGIISLIILIMKNLSQFRLLTGKIVGWESLPSLSVFLENAKYYTITLDYKDTSEIFNLTPIILRDINMAISISKILEKRAKRYVLEVQPIYDNPLCLRNVYKPIITHEYTNKSIFCFSPDTSCKMYIILNIASNAKKIKFIGLKLFLRVYLNDEPEDTSPKGKFSGKNILISLGITLGILVGIKLGIGILGGGIGAIS